MSDDTPTTKSGGGRVLALVFLGIYLLLVYPLLNSGDTLTFFSLDVPAWAAAFGFYVLGALTMWAESRR